MTALAASSTHAPAAELSDAELLQGIAWERGTPDDLIAAARRGDPVRFGAAWKRRCRDRWGHARVAPPKELLAGWSVAVSTDETLSKLIAALNAPRRRGSTKSKAAIKPPASWTVRVLPLVKALTAANSAALATPLGLLCALELLTTTTASLPQKLWWPLWRATYLALQHRDGEGDATTPDQRLLEQGELPWLAALVFGDIVGATASRKQARRLLAKELVARTDSDGTPQGELLSRLPLWLAPLVRSTVWSQVWGEELWTGEQRLLVSDITERAVALCRGDGKLALTNGLPMQPLPVLAKAAEVFAWRPANPSLGTLKLLQRQAQGHKPPARRAAIHVMPSNQSDWARLAVLRTDWTPAADTVAVAHHDRLPQVDITAAGTALVHGPWDLRVQIGDTELELAEEWSCVCWESDPDADFAELQMTGPGKLRVERLILLSRKDRFLLLADSVCGAPAGRIQLSSRLPLAPGVTAETDTVTRSVFLQAGKLRARVVPLALPCSRVYSTPHQFTVVDNQLQLQQVAEGQGLFAPLVFDWHPQRRSKDVDWRTLTVTENSRVVRGDVAAGHRLRVGSAQWLFYRSLKKTEIARAVLGHHTFNETVVARFDAQGDAEPLLMIEA